MSAFENRGPDIGTDPTLRAINPELVTGDSTLPYSSEQLAAVTDRDLEQNNTIPELSEFYHKATHAEIPFQTIRDTLTMNLPKLRANSLDRRQMLKDLERAKMEKNLDKVRTISIGLNQAEEEIEKTNQNIVSLINPEAINRTIEQLTIYKDAFLKHLEKVQSLSQEEKTVSSQDRAQLGRFVDLNKEELSMVQELIDFCLEEKARIQIEQITEKKAA